MNKRLHHFKGLVKITMSEANTELLDELKEKLINATVESGIPREYLLTDKYDFAVLLNRLNYLHKKENDRVYQKVLQLLKEREENK